MKGGGEEFWRISGFLTGTTRGRVTDRVEN